MKTRHLAVALTFILCLLGSPALAGSCGGAVQCNPGDTLASSQVMWYDMLDCPGEFGLVIIDDGITLDGNGHTIDGIDADPSDGIFIIAASMVTVKNLTITDFDTGIDLYHGDSCDISSNTISSCSKGLSVRWGYDNQFVSNAIVDNIGGSAIGFYMYACTNNSVIRNEFDNNSWRNFDLRGATQYNYIWGNSFSGSATNATGQADVINNDWNICGVGNFWDDFESNSGYPDNYVIDGTGDGVDYFPQHTSPGLEMPLNPPNSNNVPQSYCSDFRVIFPGMDMNPSLFGDNSVLAHGGYSGAWSADRMDTMHKRGPFPRLPVAVPMRSRYGESRDVRCW